MLYNLFHFFFIIVYFIDILNSAPQRILQWQSLAVCRCCMQYSNHEYHALKKFTSRNVKPLSAQQVNIAAPGSAFRNFCILVAIGNTCKRQDPKAVRLGLEALPSVPELRTAAATKESDDNLHGSACTDFIACGSCSRSTDELCQNAARKVGRKAAAKQQQ